MARVNIITETEDQRQERIFNELYTQVDAEITQKHIQKQRDPVIVQLKPFFEPNPINLIFFYDHESKADLKMLVPRLYSEEDWATLMSTLKSQSIIETEFVCPSVPVAFAKFTKLVQYNATNPLASTFEYLIDFYTQEELDKLTHAIENYEVVNYAKKATYQNRLLALKSTQNISALRQLQAEISY